MRQKIQQKSSALLALAAVGGGAYYLATVVLEKALHAEAALKVNSLTGLAAVSALCVALAVIRLQSRHYDRLKKNTDELDETRAYLQMILDNSRVLIITTDNAGRITEFNPEAERLLGYTRDELIGRDVLTLYDDPVERERAGDGADGKVWDARDREVVLKDKSGRKYHVQLTLSTMVDRKGRIKGTVGVGKDVSEQKMLRFKLVQSEKLAGIGTLASGIAHEINNPLAGILGMAEAIKDEDDIRAVRSHTEDIINYALNASSIVRELSAYSRSARSEEAATVDLARIIENSVKMARHSASFSAIDVVLDLGEGCLVRANPGELQQVFVNLLINAVQAMEGKEGGTLSVSCLTEKGLAVATVKDTGPGIPAEDVPRIYDPFFTTKPVGKGTGLGLYVVYRLVTRHGGQIDVESSSSGTAFTVRFPALEARKLRAV